VSRHILVAHNRYQQAGGEDQVYQAESVLLERNGHVVTRYEEHNTRIRTGLATSMTAIWNAAAYHRLQKLIRIKNPDVVHFHNTFPLISPAGYFASRKAGLPVVQTLHNYRLICPAGTLLRDGAVCEKCIDRSSLLPALIHGCYRGSRPATAAVTTMLVVHRAGGTWRRMVDAYIAPSEFVRQTFIRGGLPKERIFVKPNPLTEDPGVGAGNGNFALFVGRLSEEKGVRILAEAWRHMPEIPLVVAGSGPITNVSWTPNVTLLGFQDRAQVNELMRRARVLIIPSVCYETGPLTLLEAFACGLPVIASDLGSMSERVDNHRTGLLFRPGDAEDLARQVRWAWEHPEELRAMRAVARREYEQKYTAERNYRLLIDIYEQAIENANKMRGRNIA
jgi:glycosyltransferase involved in cell wall biosynthesis